MQRVGLQGGMPDGSFFQEVPLLGLTPTDIGRLTLTPEDGEPVSLSFIDEFIGSTDHDTTHASIHGDIVFVGYGIQSEAYDWDDFKEADAAGKILGGFVNDPPATADEPDCFQASTLHY